MGAITFVFSSVRQTLPVVSRETFVWMSFIHNFSDRLISGASLQNFV